MLRLFVVHSALGVEVLCLANDQLLIIISFDFITVLLVTCVATTALLLGLRSLPEKVGAARLIMVITIIIGVCLGDRLGSRASAIRAERVFK